MAFLIIIGLLFEISMLSVNTDVATQQVWLTVFYLALAQDIIVFQILSTSFQALLVLLLVNLEKGTRMHSITRAFVTNEVKHFVVEKVKFI